MFVYSDGVVDIRYDVDVDPTLASVNVSLFGKDYENIIAKDQSGILLNYKIFNGLVKIDVLGSQSVSIEYAASDLTNKTGSLWVLNLTTPINTNIQLSSRATIISLDPTPIGISMLEEMVSLTMPAGSIDITYVLGVVGTREHALALINEAEAMIKEIKLGDVAVDEAETLLQLAKNAYDEGQYVKAEQYSDQAKNSALETSNLAQEARTRIDNALSAIDAADEAGRTTLLDDAREELQLAETAFNSGNYSLAVSFAQKSLETAQISEKPASNMVTYLFGSIGLGLVALLLFSLRKKEKKQVGHEMRITDLERLFSQNAQLRLDEREVIKFIAEAREGVFVSELRQRFDIPRSSTWRMIRRLEDYELIETRPVGRETFVQIHRKYWETEAT